MRVWVAGHGGLLGTELVEALRDTMEVVTAPRDRLDLRDGAAVQRWLEEHRPDVVVLAAARVGGIAANLAAPVAFLVENLAIQNAVLPAAAASGVARLVCFGSSAMYPVAAPQPLEEHSLMSGPLDAALRPYALAKLAGMELCGALNQESRALGRRLGALCVVAPNLYGRRDSFAERATMLPALLRRVAEARQGGEHRLAVWGTGRARRELLAASEMAEAVRFLLRLDETRWEALLRVGEWPALNVGAGGDHSVGEIAMAVSAAVGWEIEIAWDSSKPEGMLRKLLDTSRMDALGWRSRLPLEQGIRSMYEAARADGRLP
ncbi:NAD-dependent epimerase/dehydratase family protein [Acidipila sp. EB88]|uniref:NAD-dependent epimerase/dehydratase family protein n=1 Tax=Acidipila sp. EB88 TaxID=2305226 RepID=UPI000F5FB731|nr:NAD-dependent epimerase/dehydratase family protein [Acidipila sp. EB88]RRA48182.1 NAD-dependent epimerase/dehydratase family protein [Acidipila sp. EB88]